jgi:hypothetical protein
MSREGMKRVHLDWRFASSGVSWSERTYETHLVNGMVMVVFVAFICPNVANRCQDTRGPKFGSIFYKGFSGPRSYAETQTTWREQWRERKRHPFCYCELMPL